MPILCIFSGASSGHTYPYAQDVERLAAMLAVRGFDFVYGGGRTGLMGAFASAALNAGAHVTGVIPDFLETLEVGNKHIQKLHVIQSTPTGKGEAMHERKALMYKQADGFIILPGGLGTMDEFMEVMTWNQLGIIDAPVFLFNIHNYWHPIIQMMTHADAQGFVHSKGLRYQMADTPDDMIDKIESLFPKK